MIIRQSSKYFRIGIFGAGFLTAGTSSDANPIIGSLDLITDGEKEAGEGYFVELLDGLQWVQIDLEKSAAIHAIWIWHFHSQRRAYHDVIVKISDDPQFKSGVTNEMNHCIEVEVFGTAE